jgi:hypothetical protein
MIAHANPIPGSLTRQRVVDAVTQFKLTIFANRFAAQADEYEVTLEELAELIRRVVRSCKRDLPQVKLGLFGPLRRLAGVIAATPTCTRSPASRLITTAKRSVSSAL